jgi:hypothetical protein
MSAGSSFRASTLTKAVPGFALLISMASQLATPLDRGNYTTIVMRKSQQFKVKALEAGNAPLASGHSVKVH